MFLMKNHQDIHRMNYIINNEILYNSFDGSLKHVKDHQENAIVISKIANSILLLLISRQGEVISRDVFFAEVWDKEGLISSGNTLNQYMSKLRRIFSEFFPEERIIITIPRVGYTLTNDISISLVINDDIKVESTFNKKRFFFPFLLLLVLIFIAIFSGNIKIKRNKSSPELVGFYKSCPVYEVLATKNLPANNFKKEFIQEAISFSGLTCEVNSKFYIFTNKIKIINNESSLLVSRCMEGDNYKNTCANVYFTNWK